MMKKDRNNLKEVENSNNENSKNIKKVKNKSKHKAIKIIGVIILIIILICVALFFVANGFINSKLNKMQYEPITNNLNELGIDEASNSDSQMSKFRNIAILGVDSRYDDYDTVYRTDCIMIASINTETSELQLYSIYRDTYVQMELDGEIILDKINHAYYNGVENTLKTINENLDLNITEYAMADFTAVVDLVDSVGGIDIDIDSEEIQFINDYIKDVTKVTGKEAENITKTGLNHLNGVQAMSYCRIRYTTGLDYKRTERMREVLGKVAEKIKAMDLGQINNLLDEFLPKIKTNLTANDIKSLIPMALSLNVKDSFGWPYTTTGVWMRGDFYGPATTLESNVKRLHEEVYGQTNYVVPESIIEISNKIIEDTGVQ